MHFPFSHTVHSAVAAVTVAGALLTAAVAPVGAASPGAHAAPAAAPAASYATFKAPSKNIFCAMSATSVRCDVLIHTYKPTKRPSWCEADWGSSMSVGKSGKGHFLCVADSTNDPSDPILAYGHSKSFGRYTCTSRTDGMRCRNRWTGHGFQVAKPKYTVW